MKGEKYVGNLLVNDVIVRDDKTPGGGEILNVILSNGQTEMMTRKTFDIIVTDKPSDATTAQKTKHVAIVADMVNLAMEYDVKQGELSSLLQLLVLNLNSQMDRALNYLWTEDDNRFVAGVNPLDDATLLEAVSIISKIPKVNEEESGKTK